MDTRAGAKSGWSFVLDEPLRVLVVDDDPILREFACVYLSAPHVTIDTAGDGEEGWERLVAGAYDIALVDIEMPRLDGYDLVTRIRADARLNDLRSSWSPAARMRCRSTAPSMSAPVPSP